MKTMNFAILSLLLLVSYSFASFMCFQENATSALDGCGLTTNGIYNFTAQNWSFATTAAGAWDLNDSDYATAVGATCGKFANMYVNYTINSSIVPLFWQVKVVNGSLMNGTIAPACQAAFPSTVALRLMVNETGPCDGAHAYVTEFCWDGTDWLSIYETLGGGDQVYEEGLWLNYTSGVGFAPLLGVCGVSYPFPVANFSLYDTTNRSFLVGNSEISVALFATGTSFAPSIFSGNFTLRQNFSICAAANTTGFTVTTNESYTAVGYDTINYYLLNATAGQNYSRYVQLNGYATRFSVFQGASTPMPNVYVQLYQYYPAINQLLLVGMGITDGNGNTVMYITPNTQLYREVIVQNGMIVYTSDLSVIPCDSGATLCTKVILTSGAVQNEYSAFVDAALVGCRVDNTTRNVICTSNDPSGTGTGITLKLYEINSFQNVLVCENTLAFGSGTVICPIPTTNHTYYYISTTTIGSETIVGNGFVPLIGSSLDYQSLGMVATAGFMIVGAGVGAAFAGGAGAMILAAVMLVFAWFFQFIVIDWTVITAVVVIAGILAYITRN